MRLRFHNSDGLLIPGAMVRINTKPVEQNLLVVIPQIAILADARVITSTQSVMTT